MADFPMAPELSKVLLAAVDLGCAEEAVTVVSMLQVKNVFHRPREKQTEADQKKSHFHQTEGDHFTLLYVYKQWMHNRFSKPWCYENFIQPKGLQTAQETKP